MTAVASEVAAAFLIFCRVGGCFLLLPGFSNGRIPVVVRLFLALSLSLALYPLLSQAAKAALPASEGASLFGIIACETAVGLVLAAFVRAVYMALETLITASSLAIGLTSVFAPIEVDESLPSIASFVVTIATALLFASDLHLELIRGMVDSYQVLPIGILVQPGVALARFVSALSGSFMVCLRVASAPIAFALLANLAAGLLNRLAPQIQAYFLAAPIVIVGGLYLIYITLTETMSVFEAELAARIFKW